MKTFKEFKEACEYYFKKYLPLYNLIVEFKGVYLNGILLFEFPENIEESINLPPCFGISSFDEYVQLTVQHIYYKICGKILGNENNEIESLINLSNED
jgi:hypothetical protein